MVATAVPLVCDGVVERLAKLTEEQVAAAAPYLADVMESAETDNLNDVERDKFRQSLNLKRLLNPTITELSGVELPPKDKPLVNRIAEGNYDWWNHDITADRFPITRGAGPDPLFLAHFGVDVSSEEVEGWAQSNGYEVANNDDLLAVGSHGKHKELQRQFLVVQLGSSTVLHGHRRVSYLCRDGSRRHLRLFYYDRGWDGRYRFLLRKVS